MLDLSRRLTAIYTSKLERPEGAWLATVDLLVSRWEAAAGWFMTTNILTKLTYTNENYFDWPTNNIKNGGKFKGLMLEAVIGF